MAIRLTVRPAEGGETAEVTFDQQRVRIGRGAMCDLRLPHPAASNVHAMIFGNDRYFLVDQGSTNGTTLGGEPLVVERRKLLRSGDVIGIAGFKIEFQAGVAMAPGLSQDRTAAVARQLAQRFMGDAGFQWRPASLCVVSGPEAGRRLEMTPPTSRFTLGRAEDNDFVLLDREVSRHHGLLEVSPEGVTISDLGGKNSVLVNDRPAKRQRLRDRDEVLLGNTRMVFDEPVEAYLRELAQWPEARMAPAADDVPPAVAPDSEQGSVGEASARRASRPARSTSPSGADRESDVLPPLREDRASSAFPSEASSGLGSEMSGVSCGVDAGKTGASTGTEIAILFVGAVALAACVAALVWIFR